MLQLTALSTTTLSCSKKSRYCEKAHFRRADRHFAAYTGFSAPVRDRQTGSPFPTGRTSKWLLPLIRHCTLPVVVNAISCSRISRGYRLITLSGTTLFVHSVRLLINFREPCRKRKSQRLRSDVCSDAGPWRGKPHWTVRYGTARERRTGIRCATEPSRAQRYRLLP